MGRGRRDKVLLTPEQRQRLEGVSRNGHSPAKKILHAQILLMCDEGKDANRRWSDEEIAAALNVHRNTVGRIRQRFLKLGEEPALNRRARLTPPIPTILDQHSEAELVALYHSPPPEGKSHWSVRMLAEELKNRGIVSEISRETVRRAIKKFNTNSGKKTPYSSATNGNSTPSNSYKPVYRNSELVSNGKPSLR